MSKILETAQELGELLVNSKEYLAKEKAEAILEGDQEAVRLLNRFQQKQQQFAKDRSNSELRKELLSLQKEVSENEKANKYFQTQKQFNQLMNNVNGEISNILNPNQGCAPGCGSC